MKIKTIGQYIKVKICIKFLIRKYMSIHLVNKCVQDFASQGRLKFIFMAILGILLNCGMVSNFSTVTNTTSFDNFYKLSGYTILVTTDNETSECGRSSKERKLVTVHRYSPFDSMVISVTIPVYVIFFRALFLDGTLFN